MTKQSIVGARGQAVIPKQIREQLGIKPHSKLAWRIQNGVIIAVPIPEDPVEASWGMLKGKGYTFEDFMEERRQERELERKQDEQLDRQLRRTLRRKDRRVKGAEG